MNAARKRLAVSPALRSILFAGILAVLVLTVAWALQGYPGRRQVSNLTFSVITPPITHAFHYIHYREDIQYRARWLGVPITKIPEDMLTYQEILFETQPDVIIEAGTAQGGSALFFASICDLTGRGRVISIDIEEDPTRPRHKRITYLLGSSTSKAVVDQLRRAVKPDDRVMVVLDSDHSKDHVLGELMIYSRLVTVDNYLVVEDTNVNGHPVLWSYGPGPMEAVKEFLAKDTSFVADRSRDEKYFLSYFPSGFLRKVRKR
jgi:cephalosporin hydroxylase